MADECVFALLFSKLCCGRPTFASDGLGNRSVCTGRRVGEVDCAARASGASGVEAAGLDRLDLIVEKVHNGQRMLFKCK